MLLGVGWEDEEGEEEEGEEEESGTGVKSFSGLGCFESEVEEGEFEEVVLFWLFEGPTFEVVVLLLSDGDE